MLVIKYYMHFVGGTFVVWVFEIGQAFGFEFVAFAAFVVFLEGLTFEGVH